MSSGSSPKPKTSRCTKKRAVIDQVTHRVPGEPTCRRCSVIEEVNRKPAEERSLGELVTDLTDEVKRLVRDELRLAMFELQRKGKRMGLGAGLVGVAGVLELFGGGTPVAALVVALAMVM